MRSGCCPVSCLRSDAVRIDVLSIFPEMFEGPMSASMMGLAREKGAMDLHLHDLREWTHDNHRTTDDAPYGGGPGMVMKPEPIFEAVGAIQAMEETPAHVVILAPVGRPFAQSIAEEDSRRERILLVCGRYEGFDERVMTLADDVLSIGDYVLTGGELPAMVFMDAVVRLLPGVLGHENSTTDESFTAGLLEYPQYTRPPEFEGLAVPEVLLSGNHGLIAAWRRMQAVIRTAELRPDLIERADLSVEERELAERTKLSRDASQEGNR